MVRQEPHPPESHWLEKVILLADRHLRLQSIVLVLNEMVLVLVLDGETRIEYEDEDEYEKPKFIIEDSFKNDGVRREVSENLM